MGSLIFTFTGKTFTLSAGQCTRLAKAHPREGGIYRELNKLDRWYHERGIKPTLGKIEDWLAQDAEDVPAGAILLADGNYISRWPGQKRRMRTAA